MVKRVKAVPTPDLNFPFSAKLIGATIKARRTQSGLRLEDCAALCGVAKQTLANIEQGQETVRLDTLLKVCTGLGVALTIKPWNN